MMNDALRNMDYAHSIMPFVTERGHFDLAGESPRHAPHAMALWFWRPEKWEALQKGKEHFPSHNPAFVIVNRSGLPQSPFTGELYVLQANASLADTDALYNDGQTWVPSEGVTEHGMKSIEPFTKRFPGAPWVFFASPSAAFHMRLLAVKTGRPAVVELLPVGTV